MFEFTEFEKLLLKSKNQLGASVLLILSWIAASDGNIDERETKRLREISSSSNHQHDMEPLIRLAIEGDLDSLQLASEIVQKSFKGEKASLFMDMAIGVAIADNYLTYSENYIIRYLADLMGMKRDQLNQAFINLTSKPIVEIPDISSSRWWRKHEEKENKKRGSEEKQEHSKRKDESFFKRLRALAILGLAEEANIDDVKKAYRRMAKIHHPDRFLSLGDEAFAAATVTFQRIEEAYTYLVNHA